MNYRKLHDLIIEKSRNRPKPGSYEKHHIIPKCLGGLDLKENIVFLTHREHFIIHFLLIKLYPRVNKLIFAFILMKGNPSKKRYFNSKLYRSAREKQVRIFKGKARSAEVKEKIRQGNLGKVVSLETKIILSKVDRSYTKTNAFRFKMSSVTFGNLNGMYGKRHSEESKKKISETKRSRRISKSA